MRYCPKNCHICKCELNSSMIIPVGELENGNRAYCCEECADKNFPEWDSEDDEEYES